MSTTFVPLSTTGPASTARPPDNLGTKDYRLAEYNALRCEILKHIDIEYQVSTLSITAFGALVALGFIKDLNTDNEGALFVFLYPVLALLLAFRWRYSEHRIKEIGTYIREYIESGVEEDVTGVKGWESYLDRHNRNQGRFGLYRLSAWGIFVFTQVLAIIIGVLLVLQRQPLFLPAAVFSFLVTIYTSYTLWKKPKGYSVGR
jgi:hypothetical protein